MALPVDVQAKHSPDIPIRLPAETGFVTIGDGPDRPDILSQAGTLKTAGAVTSSTLGTECAAMDIVISMT